MSVNIKCTTEFRTEPDAEGLTASGALLDFICQLPEGALLTPITVDLGSQRDPRPVLVGLRASWEEKR